jgi:hypothetical protein
LILAVFIISCNKNQPKNKKTVAEGITEFEFNKEIHNFGSLNAGEIVIFNFVFKNMGKNNLIITNIESDCGCINANYKSDPIMPGNEGFIEVRFNSSGLFGKQYKSIAVNVNTKEKIKYLAVVADIKNEQLEINY